MNNVEKILSRVTSGAAFAHGYADYLARVLGMLDFDRIETVLRLLETARQEGRKIFFAGNGGSAATCSHMANDFGLLTRGMKNVKPFAGVSLVDNAAYLTALANDVGFEHVFVHQLRNLFGEGDVLIAVSASGNSLNVIRAIEFVNVHRGTTIGLLGFGGGRMKALCHYVIEIPSEPGEYGPVEDVCLALNHLLTTYLAFTLDGSLIGKPAPHVGYLTDGTGAPDRV